MPRQRRSPAPSSAPAPAPVSVSAPEMQMQSSPQDTDAANTLANLFRSSGNSSSNVTASYRYNNPAPSNPVAAPPVGYNPSGASNPLAALNASCEVLSYEQATSLSARENITSLPFARGYLPAYVDLGSGIYYTGDNIFHRPSLGKYYNIVGQQEFPADTFRAPGTTVQTYSIDPREDASSIVPPPPPAPHQQHRQTMSTTASSRDTSPARHLPLLSRSPSASRPSTSSTTSSRIQVRPPPTIARQPDDAASDSDQTESDRPVGDSEETEDELYPHIPPQARVASVPVPTPVVGRAGRRGVAKAVKKGSRKPAAAKRGTKDGSVSVVGAGTRTKKKPVGEANAGKKKGPKRRKVVADVGAGEGGDGGEEDEEDPYPRRSLSPGANSPNSNNPSFTNGITNGSTTTPNPSTPLPSSSSSTTTATTPFPPGPYDPTLPLYCFCHRPDLGKLMIACDGCDDWFHGECISISESDEYLIESYFCAECTSSGKGVTEWKRMCRLPDCRRPADVARQSKYCCQEHGVEFMKLKITSEKNKLAKPVLAALAAGMESAQEFKALGEGIPTPPIDEEMGELNLDGVGLEGESYRKKMLALAKPYLEVYKRLIEISEEIADLTFRVKPLMGLRKAFIEFCWGRRARVIEQLKEKDGGDDDAVTATSMGKKGGKGGKRGKGKAGGGNARWEICGYDGVLGLGDEEFLEWVRSSQTTTSTTNHNTEIDFENVDFERLTEASGAEVGAGAETGSVGVDNLCMKKKCTKHAGWGRVKLEEVQLEERLSGDKIRGLEEEEGKEWEGLKKRVWRDREMVKILRRGGSGGGGGGGMGGEEEGGWVIDERVGEMK